ncbi:FHA domain-containing protein [Hahella ganghwensis]|uniref:FHA domain-containing protein n=1 Tax=Hahella ganghwensis TaxID=286420 RepID=UPI00035E1BF8|nr:FHA domain-containing protein [Hahella ganghwensis]
MLAKFHLKRVHDGKDFPVSRPSMLVGRSDTCDIALEQGLPSREHARLVVRKEGLFVEDLHSTNGTTVNNRRISEATLLNPGDVVKFSSEAFLISSEEESDNTIISSYLGADSSDVDSLVVSEEDEEDPDATQLQQSYPLPPGWSPLDRDRLTEFRRSEASHSRASLEKAISSALAGSSTLYSAALVVFKSQLEAKVTGLSLETSDPRWEIGRGEGADIVISDPSVSDTHAVLSYEGGHWTLKDLGSTNGIEMAGNKLTEIELQDGMVLHLGRVEVVFCLLDTLA